MMVLKEHIKTGNFKQFYLLYGREDYLKKLYRDKLRNAIIPEDDTMNYSHYEGKDLNLKELSQVAQTLPFFNNRRLIVIENSGLFKNQSELADMLKASPESTFFLFIEEEVDKRNKLFKLIKDNGTVSEMNGLDEKNLKLFVASLFQQEAKKISENTVTYLLDKCGPDMMNLRNEADKLISYCMERDVITPEDIDAVITTQITGKIFQMIDAIGMKQQNKALELYYDLLALREKPMSILFLITRHFNILLQVKDLLSTGFSPQVISEKVGVPPFAASKYIGQSKNFSSRRLKEALEYGADVEEQVKTGRMVEKIGIELLIITFSARNVS